MLTSCTLCYMQNTHEQSNRTSVTHLPQVKGALQTFHFTGFLVQMLLQRAAQLPDIDCQRDVHT